ncbi:MAG TPA: DUF1987 domain-containing protein [Bacteroidales bacterium]|nr:DUF1987 domain-containing protein [Bacteroidales bacterium]
MNNIFLEPTNNTPQVRFTTDGRLLLQGRSLPESVTKFYKPLIEWVGMLKTEVVKIDINLEYINSASSKKMFELLKILDANNCIKVLIVNWHYEADDEDALESGQIIEELLRKAEFRYHEYSEAA